MRMPDFPWAFKLIREGHTRFLITELWMRFYVRWHEWLFARKHHVPPLDDFQIQLETKHPVAYESLDHQKPWGTKQDNHTNKKFVTLMADWVRRGSPGVTPGYLDLGCSGGQLVKDFRDLGWLAVGLEGSDYSLKHGRANWPALGRKNLFTCDITKPFKITARQQPARFHLVTMWEVLEHIHQKDLPQIFQNILAHLDRGGYFVASTSSIPDVHDGVDLHQTQWTNQEWRRWLAEHYPELEPAELGLKVYQMVRHTPEESYLTYRRR